ncbi:MAG: hypothetical protein HY751_12915 [Nitrospinae bacterium]|nr:hypothetical protein [Nitrospinota bacterium]
MKVLNNFAMAVLAAGAMVLSTGCNVSLDQSKEGASSQAKVGVSWPEGMESYPYSRIAANSPSTSRFSAPSYITLVSLYITGADMEPVYMELPLDTLSADLVLTPGERQFYVMAQSIYGDTFTGTQFVNLSPDATNQVEIELEVNGPPQIISIDASNSNPSPGDSVTFSATVEESDPEDTVSYFWSVYNGRITKYYYDPSFTESISTRGGSYSISLTVDDGNGGTDYAEYQFSATGNAPVINYVSASPSTVYINNIVSLTSDAYDPDPGDTLAYRWQILSPNGKMFRFQGQSVNFSPRFTGTYTATLIIRDLQNNVVRASTSFSALCSFNTPQTVTVSNVVAGGVGSGQIFVDVSYPVALGLDGISVYNLWAEYGDTALPANLLGNDYKYGIVASGQVQTITYNCVNPNFYSFHASAGNSCLVQGTFNPANVPVANSWVQCP